jgi:tetratricopeptide (TPR) repeat protein
VVIRCKIYRQQNFYILCFSILYLCLRRQEAEGRIAQLSRVCERRQKVLLTRGLVTLPALLMHRLTIELCCLAIELYRLAIKLHRLAIELYRLAIELYRLTIELYRLAIELHRLTIKLHRLAIKLHRLAIELYRLAIELQVNGHN